MTARSALLLAAFTGALAGFAPMTAQAQDNLVVVELFTSQGCSACPPADALIGELAMRDNVIALALHVDYWDYIGWADTFASPAFTARQQGYGHAAGSTVVYTPQMIVGGHDRVVGYRPMAVADLINAHLAQPDPVDVTVTASDAGYRIEAVAAAPVDDLVEVHVVTFLPHASVEIERGENAGHTSDHYNVVQSWAVVAEWDGIAPFAFNVTPQSDLAHVVLFQAAGHGAILGAARLD